SPERAGAAPSAGAAPGRHHLCPVGTAHDHPHGQQHGVLRPGAGRLPPHRTVNNWVFCGRGPAGYHRQATLSGVTVPIAVIPTCSTAAGDPSLMGADVLTPALAHELVEAATDPFPDSAPASKTTDPAHVMWAVAMNGGEIADLCEND